MPKDSRLKITTIKIDERYQHQRIGEGALGLTLRKKACAGGRTNEKARKSSIFGCFRADNAYGNCIKDGMKIDPFAGSGTVLVEGMLYGIGTVAVNNINPLALLLIKSKNNAYSV